MRLPVLMLLAIVFLPGGQRTVAAQAAERSLFVSVLGQGGAPVPGLGPDAFVVREDGRSVEVLRASRATQPIDLAILVDNSQAASPYITDLRTGIQAFVDRMIKGGHRVAVIGLADRPTVLVDYTTDPAQAAKGVARIFAQPGSGTTLLDAVNDTSRGLQKRDGDRRVMVVITTEGTDFSTPNHERAVDAIEASGAAFDAIVITRRGGQDLSTDEARSRAQLLDQGPRVSGGRYTQLLSSMALKGELDQVATELESQYHVVYARPASLLPAEKTVVTVKEPGMTVRGTLAPVRKAPTAGAS
jgi:VWFA-related protein